MSGPLGRPFPPGVTGNPKGSSKKARIRAALKKKIDINDVIEAAVIACNATKAEIKDIIESGEYKAIHMAFASVMFHAIKKGDMGSLENLLEYVVGKKESKLKVSGIEHNQMSDEQAFERAKVLSDRIISRVERKEP